jgi:hypothetical protein
MQTFIPYADFKKSHKCLDSRRLVKQNLETTQLLDTILDLPTKSGKPRTGWTNHPALMMWKPTPGALIDYLAAGIAECDYRNFKSDYCKERLCMYRDLVSDSELPIWWGDELVHSSHRYRLLQKGYEELLKGQKNAHLTIAWYREFNWEEMKHLELFCQEYKWPMDISNGSYELEERVSKDALKNKQLLINAYGINPYAQVNA